MAEIHNQIALGNFVPQDPPEVATTIQPGPDKVRVFASRLAAGRTLYHDDDVTAFPDCWERTHVRLDGLVPIVVM